MKFRPENREGTKKRASKTGSPYAVLCFFLGGEGLFPQANAQDDDDHKTVLHDGVGEKCLPSVALDIIFHVSCQPKQSHNAHPDGEHPFSESVSFYGVHRAEDDADRQSDGGEDLHHADEAVAAQIQRIIAGAVQKNLRSAVDHEKQKRRLPPPEYAGGG